MQLKTSEPDLVDLYRRYESDRSVPSTYAHPGSIDAWRTRYVRQMIGAFVRSRPERRWLTVGDGYFGHDAHYLRGQGVSVVASALSADVLREAKERGWIDGWLQQDLTRMTLGDDSFDGVLCMEALQHCGKPWHGLHELLRVSKACVAIMGCIERRARPLDAVRERLRRSRGGGSTVRGLERYEPVGGPLFRLAPDEVAKAAALGGAVWMARRTFNLIPAGRFWARSATAATPSYLALRAGIGLSDAASRLGLLSPSFAWMILWKRPPTPPELEALHRAGFRSGPLRW